MEIGKGSQEPRESTPRRSFSGSGYRNGEQPNRNAKAMARAGWLLERGFLLEEAVTCERGDDESAADENKKYSNGHADFNIAIPEVLPRNEECVQEKQPSAQKRKCEEEEEGCANLGWLGHNSILEAI
jgi:hypothetical protein